MNLQNIFDKKGVECAKITVLDHPPIFGTFPQKNTLFISLGDSNLGEGGKSSSGGCLGVMSASWGRPLLLHQGRPECPSGYKLNLVYFTEFYTYQGPCLGIVQRFGPSEGRDWSRGVWISEESRGIEFKIFLKTISILTAVSSIKFCQGQWKGRTNCGGREDVERRPH